VLDPIVGQLNPIRIPTYRALHLCGVTVPEVCTYDVTWKKFEQIFTKVLIGKSHETLSTRPSSP
jgi:hypothetical protein